MKHMKHAIWKMSGGVLFSNEISPGELAWHMALFILKVPKCEIFDPFFLHQ